MPIIDSKSKQQNRYIRVIAIGSKDSLERPWVINEHSQKIENKIL